MSQVLDAMFEKLCTEGEHIIDQDDDGDNFYVIQRCSVKTFVFKLPVFIQFFTMIICFIKSQHVFSTLAFVFSLQWDVQHFREGRRRGEAGGLLRQQRQLRRTGPDVQHPEGSHNNCNLGWSPLVPGE